MFDHEHRRPTCTTVFHSAVAAVLVPALYATGCAQSSDPSPYPSADDGGVASHETALTSGSDLPALADRIAFDPDYVALQLRAISFYGALLPYGASLDEEEVAEIPELGVTELRARTGVTERQTDDLRALGTRVRERFPWITSHGMDLHELAICKNPRLFAAFEAAVRTVPEFAWATTTPGDPEARRSAAYAFALANVAEGSTTTDPGTGTPADVEAKKSPAWVHGLIVAVVAIAAISLLTGHPEVVAGMLIAAAVFIVGMWAWVIVRYIVEWTIETIENIVEWVRNIPETLDENFGHDDDECSDDGDCDSDEYCDNGDLLWGIFGTNTCKPDHEEGEACWSHSECETNCCKVFWLQLQCRPADKCD